MLHFSSSKTLLAYMQFFLLAFSQLLQAPDDDAQMIIRDRFPVPRLVVCDQHGSQVRFLLAKLNPSSTYNSTHDMASGSDVIFADDSNKEREIILLGVGDIWLPCKNKTYARQVDFEFFGKNGESDVRFLLAKLNPSSTYNSTHDMASGSDVIFADDVSLQVFFEHLQRLAVQQS
ncbi:hypothetical protein HHK36_020167 [Tetracentron sinense]|uniref:Protein transport protein SEC23 n=1 Tax=Tetracentron sinense TaxID=13715 RepID=A0A834YTL1_TETSI|nr:hypothetical protein HHK36_020167 [Tetracentron sinense]